MSQESEREAGNPHTPVDHGGDDDELDEMDQDDESGPLNIRPEDRKLVTQPYDLGVKGINRDIENGQIILNVEYQRKYVWDNGKASRFIESLLMNVPIPVVYFAEDESGNYEVIDGLQRLRTIQRFLDGEFALGSLPVLKELVGSRFSQLDPKDRRRLENRTIRCIVITEDSNPDIKFDVFERLNTGSARLTAQELRNSVHRGPLNDDLKRLAEFSEFKALLPGATNRRMDFEEIILRFFAFVSGQEGYKPPLRQFLNEFNRQNRRIHLSAEQVELFRATCKLAGRVLGEAPFRVPGSANSFNKAMFDAIMIPFALSDQEAVVAQSKDVKAAIEGLHADPEFARSIGRATADRTRVFYRADQVRAKLASLGIDATLPLSLHYAGQGGPESQSLRDSQVEIPGARKDDAREL